LPDFLVGEALADGRLVSVLEQELGPSRQFRALWPSSRHLSPKVRVFVDYVGERLSGPP
jgi:DNA-binding transcriptional LysR family regulator